jgi:hypothetical protein
MAAQRQRLAMVSVRSSSTSSPMTGRGGPVRLAAGALEHDRRGGRGVCLRPARPNSRTALAVIFSQRVKNKILGRLYVQWPEGH